MEEVKRDPPDLVKLQLLLQGSISTQVSSSSHSFFPPSPHLLSLSLSLCLLLLSDVSFSSLPSPSSLASLPPSLPLCFYPLSLAPSPPPPFLPASTLPPSFHLSILSSFHCHIADHHTHVRLIRECRSMPMFSWRMHPCTHSNTYSNSSRRNKSDTLNNWRRFLG